MELFDRVRQLFRPRAADPGDALATLLRAAQEDAALRLQLLALLRAPPLQRESMVHTAVHEMALRGEPAEVRAAFAVLATEAGAKTALAVLEQP